MANMVWRPRFGELEAEREVVMEEIAMYRRRPPRTESSNVLGARFGEPLGGR